MSRPCYKTIENCIKYYGIINRMPIFKLGSVHVLIYVILVQAVQIANAFYIKHAILLHCIDFAYLTP